MKTLLKLLILASFATVIFFQNSVGRTVYWLLFVLMGVLLVCYWFLEYWVSRKDLEKIGLSPSFDIFCGKIPAVNTDDLTRGRLAISNGEMALYKRTTGQARKTKPCEKVWSISTDKITSLAFGKVLTLRKGFMVYMENDEIQFSCRSIVKHKDDLYKALGWEFK